MSKKCTNCLLEKELCEFFLKGILKDTSLRYDDKCKVCRTTLNKASYQKNKESRRAQKKEYYQINQSDICKSKRQQYNSNPEFKEKLQKISKKSRLKNKDKIAAGRRTPIKRFSLLKSSAKQRKLGSSITFDQYKSLIDNKCNYCDDYFAKVSDSTGIGLDRLDNSKGYHLDNVVPCCTVCNRVRGDHFTPEETKIAVQTVISFRIKK